MAETTDKKKPLVLRDAEIFFRNFAGLEREYNNAGQRNFCVALDVDLAEKLKADGWNIKYRKQLEEGDPVRPYVEVKVRFDGKVPAKVKVVTKEHPTGKELTPDEAWTLDALEIKRVDLSINPYHYDVNGTKGVKAYLKSLYLTPHVDELDAMYEGEAVSDVGATLLPFPGAPDDESDIDLEALESEEGDGVWRGEVA